MAVRKIDIKMNRRNLPFNALRAFEAAARHASVTGAALELSVTHSAVSHQIKQLESKLGVTLFHRSNRGLTITAQGQALLPVVMQSFDQISVALDDIHHIDDEKAIHLTTTPSFASKWLVPRMSDWYASTSATRIHLLPSLDYVDFKTDNVDYAIRCGIPPWPGLHHELFMPINLMPVCSPDYAQNHPPVKTPADVLAHNLIHADVGKHSPGEEWCDWMRGCGVDCADKIQGISFHDPALAMQAAADGLGLAIGYLELIDADLHTGKLVAAFEMTVQHQYSYYLVYNKTSQNKPKIAEFHCWLLAQL